MRPKLIAGNWKMNTLYSEARYLAHQVLRTVEATLRDSEEIEVVLCPPATWITEVGRIIERSPILLGAQDAHCEQCGAFTGSISAPMLKSAGVEHVIVGHSERRKYCGEADDVVNQKVQAVLASGMRPIVCVGESAAQRRSGKTNQVVLGQVRAALQGAREAAGNGDAFLEAAPAVAYEPLWAIGSGTPATGADAADMAQLIRETLTFELGEQASQRIRVLYGGSVKPSNVEEFATLPELDGVLVGGASLSVDDFCGIIQAYHSIT